MLDTLPIKEFTTFDPKLPEHIWAYHSVRYLGRQTNLRFHLEPPFLDVVSMMQHKIMEAYMRDFLGT